MKHDKILAGRVVNAHGVRGEVRVLPVEADLLARARALYLDGERRPVTVRPHKGGFLVRFPGVDTMDAALALKGKPLYADRPADAAWFDEELLGMEVLDGATGALLGTLTAVEDYPASKIYTVQGEKTYLIPAVEDAFILSVDVERGRMEVRVWEGLDGTEHGN